MWVGVNALFRCRNADGLQKFKGPLARDAAGQILVQDEALGNLCTYREYRIQRCHRFLKNHSDPITANPA